MLIYRSRLFKWFATVLFYSAAMNASAALQTLQPFSTDGCSLFPNRSLIGKEDWCNCCLKHDLAYWKGGTSEDRLAADQELKGCVQKTTGNKALGELMYAGVRAGGGPYYYTSYRWAYGWPHGRLYQSLTTEEQATASKLESEYRAGNPSLSCPK